MSKNISFDHDGKTEILRLEPGSYFDVRDGVELWYEGEMRFAFTSNTKGSMIRVENKDGALAVEEQE